MARIRTSRTTMRKWWRSGSDFQMLSGERHSRGFTLIEILVVLVITSLLAAAVTFKLWEPLRVATAADVCEQVETFDHWARTRARHSADPVKLVFEVGRGEAMRKEAIDSTPTQRLRLARGWIIERLWVEGQESSSGEVEIELSACGYTPTYAIRLEGPEGVVRWLIVAGMGGDVTKVTDDAQAQTILEAIGPDGADAR